MVPDPKVDQATSSPCGPVKPLCLLCASVKPAAKVCSSSRSWLKNRCYMWVELSWIITFPRVTVTCKIVEFRSSCLPWVSLSCYTAESQLPVSHIGQFTLGHLGKKSIKSWGIYTDQYQVGVLISIDIPGVEGKNGRPPPQMCKNYNFIFLQLNSIPIEIPIPWRKERGQFKDCPHFPCDAI